MWKLHRQQGDRPAGPSGELLRIRALMEFGITHAMAQGLCNHLSVGSKTNKEAIVPDNVIALYNDKNGAFVRMWGSAMEYGGGARAIDALPFGHDCERFLVVDAGLGSIALYNPTGFQFVCSKGSSLVGSGVNVVDMQDAPRGSERFYVEEPGDGTVCFCCSYESGWRSEAFRVVQVQGIM